MSSSPSYTGNARPLSAGIEPDPFPGTACPEMTQRAEAHLAMSLDGLQATPETWLPRVLSSNFLGPNGRIFMRLVNQVW